MDAEVGGPWSRLRPLEEYGPGSRTYGASPPPEDIAAAVQRQRAAYWSRQAARQAVRAGRWAPGGGAPQTAGAWLVEAERRRGRLADLLALHAAPPLQAQEGLGSVEAPGGGTRALVGFVLQGGGVVRAAAPASADGAAPPPAPGTVRLLPPQTVIEGYAGGRVDEWWLELPALRAADEPVAKATLLQGLTVPGLACAQLHQAVEGLAGRFGAGVRPVLCGAGVAGLTALCYAALDPRMGGVAADLTGLAGAEWPGVALIPGFDLEFDIESLVQLLAPRPAWLAGVDGPDGPPWDIGYARRVHGLWGAAGRVRFTAPGGAEVPAAEADTGPGVPAARFARPVPPPPRHVDGVSPEEWPGWRDGLRSRFLAAVGGVSRPGVSGVEVRDLGFRDGVAVERVSWSAGPDVRVYGLLLRPTWRPGPLPAVLCLPGSAMRPEDLLPSWGGMVAEAGYAAFLVDVKPARLRSGIHREIAEGRAMVWNLALDVLSALDYLAGRPDIDAGRIAALGVSIGGTQAWMAAALDPRVRVAIPVVGVTSYASLSRCVLPGGRSYLQSHGWYYYHPVLQIAEQYDLVSLAAPRPLALLATTGDDCFPVDGVRECERRIGALYATLGVPERFETVVEPGPHGFPTGLRRAALGWLERWL